MGDWKGFGVPQDYGKSARWFRRSAEQGYAAAQTDLGFQYMNGIGVPKDPVQGANWFLRAARQGYAMAQYNLGMNFALGQGKPKDAVLAYAWIKLAISRGYSKPRAPKALNDLEQKITSNEVAAAQVLAANWRQGQQIARPDAGRRRASSDDEKKIVYAYRDWVVVRETKGALASCSANSYASRAAAAGPGYLFPDSP